MPDLAAAIREAEEARQRWRDSPLTGMVHVPQATRDDAAALYNSLGALLTAVKATSAPVPPQRSMTADEAAAYREVVDKAFGYPPSSHALRRCEVRGE